MKRVLALMTVLAAGPLNGCPASTPDTGVQPTFAALSKSVFVGCSTQACHGGPAPRGNLSLEADKAYAALVGAGPDNAQARADGLLRVSPGQPDRSFLLSKVTAIAKPAYGTQMPVGGHLSTGQVAALRVWIERGAPND